MAREFTSLLARIAARAMAAAPSSSARNRRSARWRNLAAAALLLLGAAILSNPQRASAASTVQPVDLTSPGATPDKVRQLLDLLEDPDVRSFLARRKAPSGTAQPEHAPETMAGGLGDELQNFRDHVRALAAAAPHLPDEFDHARSMLVEAVGRREILTLGLFLATFVALGFGSEWLFRALTSRFRAWLIGLELETARERVWAVFARLTYGLGLVGSYALGSIGAFLLFDWSHLLKEILLGYLLASLLVRLTFVICRFFLAPGADRFRVAPISTEAAGFLFRRIGLLAILLAFGWQTINLLGDFGFSSISRELSTNALGILVLAIALETVWRVPLTSPPRLPIDPEGQIETMSGRYSRPLSRKAALSGLLVLLWGLWAAEAATAFWLVAFGVGLPIAIMMTQRSIHHVLRPTAATDSADGRRLEVIFIERGVRSLMIVVAAVLLGRLLGVDLVSLTMQDTITTRILRGILGVVIVVLIADFLWHAIAALIDRKLASDLGATGTLDDTGHAARLQTLLPILKNLLLAVLAVLAFMMVLAALGIEIGPLIASAGVVGVAIGFGAQTLVKDIISGIFYLVDDAFRIGEYIQSGTYKGTVESFSLRSVKLRHQRGALYTVPFGILGAVQNQSRDWVVDKITINVPYETDLEKVRKLIKKIGEALAEDPELGPDIIKPLKMQGVAQFGDYAIQIQTKMMTKPGDVQFAARRRALIMIKQAFEANNIGFALPMVHVAGDSPAAAAAQKGLSLVQGGKVDEAI